MYSSPQRATRAHAPTRLLRRRVYRFPFRFPEENPLPARESAAAVAAGLRGGGDGDGGRLVIINIIAFRTAAVMNPPPPRRRSRRRSFHPYVISPLVPLPAAAVRSRPVPPRARCPPPTTRPSFRPPLRARAGHDGRAPRLGGATSVPLVGLVPAHRCARPCIYIYIYIHPHTHVVYTL